MKRRWAALERWLAGRAERERAAVLGAFILVVGALAYAGWIEPALAQRAAALTRIAQGGAMLAAAQAQHADTARALGTDPTAAVRERIGAVRRELDGIDGDIGALQRTLLPPERMAGVLQQLLGKDPRVRLVSMRNLPPEAIDGEPSTHGPATPAGQARPGTAAAQVFRHGIEVEIEGGYLDLLAYLDMLERQPWQLFWGQVSLQADYPRATLRLTLYTLSLDRAWLVV